MYVTVISCTNNFSRYICPQRSRFPRHGSLLVIGQFKESWERGQFVKFMSSRAVKWCEMYMKFIFVLRLSMKVKNDHRTKFSNLSNWKEEAWNITTARAVGRASHRCRGGREFESRWRLLPSNCINWKIYFCDHSSLSFTTAVQIWNWYIFHINLRNAELEWAAVRGDRRSIAWRP